MESINEKRPKIRYKAHTKGVRMSFVSVFCVVFDIAIDISDKGKIVFRCGALYKTLADTDSSVYY